MKRLIIGNWKMNLDNRLAEVLVDRLRIHTTKPTAKIVLCPSFIALDRVSEKIKKFDQKVWSAGAQNINDNDEGAFTGEVSGPMLKPFAKYCIVGHSERRIKYGEGDELIARKVAACMRSKIIPILCVGENLHQREEDLAKRTVMDQLEEDLSELTIKEVSKVVIAYEPVWAIGTGENATPADVEIMFEAIYKFLINKYGAVTAAKMPLLYGGSVNGDNAKTYLSTQACSGLLIGGASLNYKDFSNICQL